MTTYNPVTTITLIATGAPHIWLFDSGLRMTLFTYGWQEPHGGPKTLRRYAEAWQRLSPSQGALRSGGYAPGLKIRYADQDGKPYGHDTEISTPSRITAAQATSNRYFTAKSATAFGTYCGQSWVMNWVTGERILIDHLRMEGGQILYSRNGVERNVWDGPFYDYLTGEQITDDPPAKPEPAPIVREEEMCDGICGQPAYACTCIETKAFRNHDPADGVWTA